MKYSAKTYFNLKPLFFMFVQVQTDLIQLVIRLVEFTNVTQT